MISKITFGTSIVENSITNSNATLTVDNTQPLSFLEFIKNTNTDYTPEEYNNFYISYLKEWASIVNTNNKTSINFIDLYVDFLKNLILTYSTQQELKFMSTLDFTDPVDLDIAIPLYVEKIRQVVIFYKETRESSKYVVDKNKIKGSATSIEKVIFEKIYNYIFSSDQQPQYSFLNLSLSSIVSEMKIDIEEFVDVYGNYFDLPRTNTGTSTLRDVEYQANINDIDVNLFFKDILPQDIFTSQTFLLEIPLAVNYAVYVDPICDPTNPLNFINTSQNDKDALKRELISKYVGVDFYYISTINGSYTYDKFITAQNPTGNIPNLQTADTATVESTEVKLLRDIGLFFKPDTTGLFQLNSNNYTYSIDKTKLLTDKVYIFPDPNVYGNVSINNQIDYPLVFIHDYTKDIKNNSSGFASSDPKINNYEQAFTAYYTKQQTADSNFVSEEGVNLNFSDLYNKGYITKVQYDIFGNEYALFKDEFGQTFKSVDSITSNLQILDLVLDGYRFYDNLEGYNFDYSIVGTVDGSTRSGLTAQTVNSYIPPASAQFTLSGAPYTLYFREFTPYQEVSIPARNTVFKFKDAGSFTFQDNTLLPDPLAADDYNYPSLSPYYYTELVEAGVNKLSPYIVKGYTSATIDQSNFTLNVKNVLSSVPALNSVPSYLQVNDFDCGYFTDISILNNSYNYNFNGVYYDNVSNNSLTVISSLTGDGNEFKTQSYKRKLAGNLFVKNQRYSQSYPISATLGPIYNKYTANVQQEVYSSMKDFDVIYDSIICETNSYLIFDKINYENNNFVSPNTKNTYFTRISTDATNKFSNRFFNEKDKLITFCTISQLISTIPDPITTEMSVDLFVEPLTDTILTEIKSLSGSNYKILYPTIYQYDIVRNTTVQVFPRLDDLTTRALQLFGLRNYITNNFDINIIKVDKPIITYNTFNRIYKLSYTCTDNNNMAYVYDYSFDIVNDFVTFYDARLYKTDKAVNTTGFYNASTQYAATKSIQGALTSQNGTLIL